MTAATHMLRGPRRHERRAGMFGLWLIASVAAGCGNEIGDACQNALDCSPSGSRQCDLTQPAGYCTVDGCEEGSCPEESVCVLFGHKEGGQFVDRLSRTYCMYKCDETSDCRDDEGYQCFSAGKFGGGGTAKILGSRSQKFCAPKTPVASDARAGRGGVSAGAGARGGAGSDAGEAGSSGGAGAGGASDDDAGEPMMSLPDGG